ncbi:hypothetical protein DFH11DRAFT_1613032 [Phellopilus nigrolimitatus]|nr:hypothetical protein DFH11DRAFT_1613032 [Phellopilus nigrolimitatus]
MVAADPQAYRSIQSLHRALPAFAPSLSESFLPYLAFFLLTATFTLAFYFSTLPKSIMALRELGIASTASILGGFGVVALFCSVGVYV